MQFADPSLEIKPIGIAESLIIKAVWQGRHRRLHFGPHGAKLGSSGGGQRAPEKQYTHTPNILTPSSPKKNPCPRF